MKSSLLTRRLPTAAARYGQVLAARAFLDPERGLAGCPAAPLLAVTPDRLLGPDEVPGPCPAGEGDGVMFTVSWLDRGGTVSGLALIAHREDAKGLATAERQAARWARAVRSRRLLVADTGGLCPGGRRAARIIEAAAGPAAGPVYVLGRPVADADSLRKLSRKGARVAEDLYTVPDDAVVVLPAHGAGLGARAEAGARGLAVVDGTCPLVAAAQADAFRYAERGDMVVVVGHAGHAALPPLRGHAGPAAVIAGTAAEAGRLPVRASGSRREVSFVIDPAMPADDAMIVVAALRKRFPGLRGHHFDVLCEAASDWTQSVAAVAAGSDLVLVLAAGADDDEVSAVRATCGTARPVLAVTSLADLDAETLGHATVIGLVTTLSAPSALPDQVRSALAGLGPLSARHRGTRTRPEPLPEVSQHGGPGQDLLRAGIGGIGAEP